MSENRFSKTTLDLPPLIAPVSATDSEELPADTASVVEVVTPPAVEEVGEGSGDTASLPIPPPQTHLDFSDDESAGVYKVAVEIPTAFDEVLTAALIGKRWARVGKKVGKLVVLRAIILCVLRRVDFSEFTFTDPDELEDQILAHLLASQ